MTMLMLPKPEHTAPSPVGHLVGRVLLELNGWLVPVVPVSVAALRLGYSVRYTRLLCDTGYLIATKAHGRWWVHEHALKT